MASNNSKNNVKHKLFGYYIAFSNLKNKWEVKNGEKFLFDGNFKECKNYCKINKL